MKLKKILSSFLIACMMISILPIGVLNVHAYAPAQDLPNISGKSQREAIIAIALSQKGYQENGGTIYGKWYEDNIDTDPRTDYKTDYTYEDWCAIFIGWCADKAGISSSIIKPTAWAGRDPMGSNIRVSYEDGKINNFFGVKTRMPAGRVVSFSGQKTCSTSDYTPRKGDIVWIEEDGVYENSGADHVGMVAEDGWHYDGEKKQYYVKTIEGNTGGWKDHRYVKQQTRYVNEIWSYGVPDYIDESGYTPVPKPAPVTPSYNKIDSFPLPIICYTESGIGAQTNIGDMNSSKKGYISASTQCKITAIYDNGKVLVEYGGKEGYAAKSSFMRSNGALKEARVSYNQPVYTRSNLSQTIGEVYATDSIKVVYETFNVAQIIYPTPYGFKMGWIDKSRLKYGDNVAGGSSSYTAVEGVPRNIKSYTLRSGQISTYDDANGNKIGWIDGAVDLCNINQVYTNNWLNVNYPVPGRTKNGWTPSTEFADSFTIKRTTKAISNQPVYTTSAMTKKIGEVYANDNVLIVSESGSKLQIIYPISGGYKMGWIEASKLESQVKSVEVKTTPTKTTYVQGEKLNTSGLSVVTNYIGGAFKWIGRKLGVMDDEEGYELRNTELDSVGTHTIAIEYE